MPMVDDACEKVEGRLISAANNRDVNSLIEVLKKSTFLGRASSTLSEEDRDWALSEISNPVNGFGPTASMLFLWSR